MHGARVDLFISCLFVRNENSTVGLSFDCIFRQRPGRWLGYYAAVEIVAAIMARTSDDRLPRQVGHGATFVRANGAEGQQFLIGRLQSDHPLPTHREDDKFILLQFGSLFTRQTRRPGRSALRQRLEITDHRVCYTHQPAEDARAQQKIEKITA
jgi:hypothetical protein